jgi:hypothetical protein
MKDDASDLVLASKLRRIEIGTDSKNNPITSCTVEPVKLDPNNTNSNLPRTQRFALDALKKVLASTDGVEVKTDSDLAKKGIPIGTRVCKSEIWRQAFYDTYPGDKQDTKKKALLRYDRPDQRPADQPHRRVRLATKIAGHLGPRV